MKILKEVIKTGKIYKKNHSFKIFCVTKDGSPIPVKIFYKNSIDEELHMVITAFLYPIIEEDMYPYILTDEFGFIL